MDSAHHKGRRCGMVPVRKPVRALSQPLNGIKSAKLHRTLSLISASVGEGVKQ